jgi:hypothetical protein
MDMTYCPFCGSHDLYEYCIERGESWYYCYACKTCFGEPITIPFDEFLTEVGNEFPDDADRLKHGDRAD